MTDADLRLVEYALGTMDAGDRLELELELRARADLRSQLLEVTAVLDHIGAAAEPLQPRPQLRETLLKTIEPRTRFEGYLQRVAQLFDFGIERAQQILHSAETDASVWRGASAQGVQLMHFAGGPQVAGADCGLVCLDPGAEFPRHRHLGDEIALVLAGEARDDQGCVLRPGDIAHMEPGSSHSFASTGQDALLLAVVVNEGIDFS